MCLTTLAVSSLCLTTPLAAQVLDLGGRTVPELPESNFASTRGEILREEIDTFAHFAASAAGLEHVGLTARATLRRVAASLLERATLEQDASGRAFMHGYTLARNRAGVDDSIERLISGARRRIAQGGVVGERLGKAIEALRVFNEEYRPLPTGPMSGEALDAVVAGLVAPLLDAITAAEDRASETHWPVSGDGAGGPISEAPEVSDLRAVSEQLALDDAVRTSLEEILVFLESGGSFVELRPHIARYRRLLGNALELVHLCHSVDWSDDMLRSTVIAQCQRAISVFRDKGTREIGCKRLNDLGLVLQQARGLSELRAQPRRRLRVDAIREVLVQLMMQLDDEQSATAARANLRLLGEVIDRMTSARQLEPLQLSRELRSAGMKLDRQYEDAEVAMLDELPLLLEGSGVMADPAFNSVFNRHRQYYEDTLRMRALPGWIDAIGGLSSSSRAGFEALTVRMAQWLLDPARRDQAVLAMDQFEDQLDHFAALHAEAQLRAEDPDTASPVAGRHAELLAAIEESLRAWADAWAVGDAASLPALRLAKLYRLVALVRDLVRWEQISDDLDQLNAWAGWELPGGTIGGVAGDVAGKVDRCLTAILDGKAEPAARLLDQVERQTLLVRLCVRLDERLESSEPRPLVDDPVGVLNQLVHVPGPAAALVRWRSELAEVVRFVLESGFARRNDRAALADEINLSLERLITNLLRQLGDRELTIAPVPGFDGR